MAVFELGSPLTTEERLYKRRLILHDVLSLFGLFLITVALAVATYLLFNSFSKRRQQLARDWQRAGNKAMSNGHPEEAVEAFRSALEYDPNQRDTEIKLAMALAAAGHTDQAISYFNTLLESEPGNGLINLELARLAAKQGNESRGVEYYQRALDGTWQGDGYERRRAVRLELARYLIDRKDYGKARTELLIAAGNAPDDPKVKLEIAGMMEEAQDPTDALEIYRALADQRHCPIGAVEGAARVAFQLGQFKLAREYFARVVSHPDFASAPQAVQETTRNLLSEATDLLNLFPSTDLGEKERAERILHAEKVARDRFDSCSKGNPAPAATTPLTDLTAKWQQVPPKLTATKLAGDPQLERTIISLVFDTEKQTAQACGAPTGEDALLLKIAQSPSAVEQQ